MKRELVIQSALQLEDRKALEIVIVLSKFRNLKTTRTTVDADTGEQLGEERTTDKQVLGAFGETLYCPDREAHVHNPAACAKAHPEYSAKKKVLEDAMAAFEAKRGPIDVTPEDRKLE